MNCDAIKKRAVELMADTIELPYEPGYRLHHGERTATLCMEIADAEGLTVDREALALGALMHDIGKSSSALGESHGVRGAHMVKELFADLMTPDELAKVAEIVEHHYERPNSKWFASKAKPVWNTEILVVQDADVLDHFGIPGIWLSMHLAVQKKFSPALARQEWFEAPRMVTWRADARRSLNFESSRRSLELRITEMNDFFRRLA